MPFPFDDLSAVKARPAACLTEPVGSYRHIVLAFITSRIPSDLLDSDVVLDSAGPSFSATGLSVPSTLRLQRMVTVMSMLIRRELGSLSPDMQIEVASKLRRLFVLP